mmetsp:Transcript_28155/g.21054  ORF Transcript_28155/g.21054 Transcript_28155/m.21054 type:complete len:135 (-) Transcript_28155:468-872(-)
MLGGGTLPSFVNQVPNFADLRLLRCPNLNRTSSAGYLPQSRQSVVLVEGARGEVEGDEEFDADVGVQIRSAHGGYPLPGDYFFLVLDYEAESSVLLWRGLALMYHALTATHNTHSRLIVVLREEVSLTGSTRGS